MTTPAMTRIRASDQDREQVVERLRDAHVDGRLTLAELEERVDAGYRATYTDELPALVADLPPLRTADLSTTSGSGWPSRPSTGWSSGGLPRWPFPPFVLMLVVASVLLVVTGHAPFPLLWLAVVFFFWSRRGWGMGREVRRRRLPA